MESTKQINKIKTQFCPQEGRYYIYLKSYNDWLNIKNDLREVSIKCYRNSEKKKLPKIREIYEFSFEK